MPSKIFGDEPIVFPQAYRPIFPGGPGRPPHPLPRRLVYGCVGMILAIAAGFGNALVTANTTYLLGALGADTDEAAWIPTVYVMTYITMNLIAVKFRQQFGIRLFAMLGLIAFCIVMALHLIAGGVSGAIYIHAFAGIAAAPLITLTIYYFMAAFPPAKVVSGGVLGFSMLQVSTPLARLLPGDDFIHDQWITLYCFELGLALICLAAVGLVRLPPSERGGGFEALDLISYPLLSIGLGLVTVVIGLGRYLWWTDTPWLGWCLAAGIAVLMLAALFESCRSRPLVELRWLGAEGLFRFALVVVAARIVLAQQQTVAFGLLGNAGILTTNVRVFCAVLACAAVLGGVAAAATVRLSNIPFIGAVGLGIVAIAAFVESFSTNLTRGPELIVTEAMISFATTLAVGPSIGVGGAKVLRSGGRYLASFLVVFAITQNLGGLAGSGLLATMQIVHEKANSVVLVERAPAFDPSVQAWISNAGGGQTGLAALQRVMTREANILAYNNTSFFVAILAALTSFYLVCRGILDRRSAARSA